MKTVSFLRSSLIQLKLVQLRSLSLSLIVLVLRLGVTGGGLQLPQALCFFGLLLLLLLQLLLRLIERGLR